MLIDMRDFHSSTLQVRHLSTQDKLEVLCIARQANYSYLHDTQQNWCYLSRANNCLPNIHTHSHEVHVVCFVCYSCSPSILHTATNKKHLQKKTVFKQLHSFGCIQSLSHLAHNLTFLNFFIYSFAPTTDSVFGINRLQPRISISFWSFTSGEQMPRDNASIIITRAACLKKKKNGGGVCHVRWGTVRVRPN